MTILHRYLLRQNLLYLGVCLITCVGIYLLIDVFDRLDRLLEKGAHIQTIILYFTAKIPLIVSQILPASFFLALLIQFSFMHKDREITALESGGIPYYKLILFFLLYCIFWCGIQLSFSQGLGVVGERKSEAIWDNLGQQKEDKRETIISDVWFRKKQYIVHIEQINLQEDKGKEVSIYVLDHDFSQMKKIIEAEKFVVKENQWRLINTQVVEPQKFSLSYFTDKVLNIEQDLDVFRSLKDEESPEEMTLWKLGKTINMLKSAGSNVETLVTAWHMKLSYAFSILVLTIVGLVMTKIWHNIFWNLSIGVIFIFLFYSLHIFGGSLGEKGIVAPWVGGWLGQFIIGIPCLLILIWQTRSTRVTSL